MAEEKKPVDFARLRRLMWISSLVAAGVLVLSLWQLGQFTDFELGWTVMAAAFAAITWSGIFYFGCLMTAGSLMNYILSDDTEIKGQTVEMVTKTRSSGDRRLDAWVDKFVIARNTFGLSVIPLLILAGVFIWY